MRLSTKNRFAITAMFDLALPERHGPASLSTTSEHHQISLSCLEQMYSQLCRRGLVLSTRGPRGGHSLARSVSAISVAEIVGAVDNRADSTIAGASGHSALAKAKLDMSKNLWEALHSKMAAYMTSITLRHLADEQGAKGARIENPQTLVRGVFSRPKDNALKVRPANAVFSLAQTLSS